MLTVRVEYKRESLTSKETGREEISYADNDACPKQFARNTEETLVFPKRDVRMSLFGSDDAEDSFEPRNFEQPGFHFGKIHY